MYKEFKVNFFITDEQNQRLKEMCSDYNQLHGTTLQEDDFFSMIMTSGSSKFVDERIALFEGPK